MGWVRLVGSLKQQVSFAEYSLFYRALLQKRPIVLRSLLIVATPIHVSHHARSVCVAVCCSALQCVAVRCSALQCVAVCCSALQCVAVRCSVLQCVAGSNDVICVLLIYILLYMCCYCNICVAERECHIYIYIISHVPMTTSSDVVAAFICIDCRAKIIGRFFKRAL